MTVAVQEPSEPTVFTVVRPAFRIVPPVCCFKNVCMISSPSPSFTILAAVALTHESNVTTCSAVSTVKV